jgi:hypothetical protein
MAVYVRPTVEVGACLGIAKTSLFARGMDEALAWWGRFPGARATGRGPAQGAIRPRAG